MPVDYLPIIFFAVVMLAFPIVTLGMARLVRPESRDVGARREPYECGIPPEGDARGRFGIRFYIIAMLFVIFDIETIFLFPWAVQYRALGLFGLIEMVVFLGILIVGYAWVYKKGALDWD